MSTRITSRKSRNLILILGVALLLGCGRSSKDLPPSDAETDMEWYKGNLHTHSYWSDGDEFPEMIMDWYKSNGYQFVALSDHNTLAEGEKWKVIGEEYIYRESFQRYLDTYGANWVNYRSENGPLEVRLKTLEEYRGLFEEEGKFLILPSEEITDQFEDKPIHLNATNLQKKIEPQGGESVLQVLQRNINAVLRQREETGIPMIPHINHPNFGFGVALEDILGLTGERFFELYNGHPSVHNSGDSTHISTEEMWDLINITYLEKGQPLLYGLATDDSHHYHRQGAQWANSGRGWIMVQADTLSPEAIIEAMETGRFYASTGVTLDRLTFSKNRLSVKVKEEEGIFYSISFIGCREGKTIPEVFETVSASEAEFFLTPDILFVRGKITSSQLHPNPIEELLYEMAWTQPVMWED